MWIYYWGDSTIRNTPKLFLAHTGNLIPPSDRACWTIIMKKKIQNLEITKKTKFSSRKSKIWDFFSGVKLNSSEILLNTSERVFICAVCKTLFMTQGQVGVKWGQIENFALKWPTGWLMQWWVIKMRHFEALIISTRMLTFNFTWGHLRSNEVEF